MTRVDLYEEMRELSFQKANVVAEEDCQYLIDKVFNYFENKNCINCKHFADECCDILCSVSSKYTKTTISENNFYCSLFKPKENE